VRELPPAFTHLLHGDRSVIATVDPTYAVAVTAGHFPDEALLPGSALLDLMVLAARALAAETRGLTGIERAVFRRRVHPADRIVVTVHESGAPYTEALVRANDLDAARARLRFEPPA